MKKKNEIWYAVCKNERDHDWETGSHDLYEAEKMALRAGDESYIAMIEVDKNLVGVCLQEIGHDEIVSDVDYVEHDYPVEGGDYK